MACFVLGPSHAEPLGETGNAWQAKRFQTWQCPLPKYVMKASWIVMTRLPFSGGVRR